MIIFSVILALVTTLCTALWLKRMPFTPGVFRAEYLFGPLLVFVSFLQVVLVVVATADGTRNAPVASGSSATSARIE